MYTYKDIGTGKIRKTHGEFSGWQKGGILGAQCAVFQNARSVIYIPVYLLTPETKAKIGDMPKPKVELTVEHRPSEEWERYAKYPFNNMKAAAFCVASLTEMALKHGMQLRITTA